MMITNGSRQPGRANDEETYLRAPGTNGVRIAQDDAESPSTPLGWAKEQKRVAGLPTPQDAAFLGMRPFVVHEVNPRLDKDGRPLLDEHGVPFLPRAAFVEARSWYAARAFGSMLFSGEADAEAMPACMHVAYKSEGKEVLVHVGKAQGWVLDGDRAFHVSLGSQWRPWAEAVECWRHETE